MYDKDVFSEGGGGGGGEIASIGSRVVAKKN